MATPTIINIGTAVKVGSGNMAGVVLPASILTNDILGMIVTQGDNIVGSVGGTWSQKDALNNGAASRWAWFWSRYNTGDAAPTVTRAGGDSAVAQIIAVRGCPTTGDPFTAGISQANVAQTGANSTVAIPSITPNVGDLVLILGGAFNSDTSTPLSFSGYSGSPTPTERLDSETGLGAREVALFIASLVSDGSATGARTVTTTNAATQSTLSIGAAFSLAGIPDPSDPVGPRTEFDSSKIGPF